MSESWAMPEDLPFLNKKAIAPPAFVGGGCTAFRMAQTDAPSPDIEKTNADEFTGAAKEPSPRESRQIPNALRRLHRSLHRRLRSSDTSELLGADGEQLLRQ